MTTATLQVCPASPVAQPRETIGAPCLRQTSVAATTSLLSRGTTTPIGGCR
jgi:hypothetical protein